MGDQPVIHQGRKAVSIERAPAHALSLPQLDVGLGLIAPQIGAVRHQEELAKAI